MSVTYEDIVADHRPFRRRQIIALTLLICAGVGVLVVLLGIRDAGHTVLLGLLLHAFEGAVVGGVCDWYAVAKTYRAVETNRNSVADALGRWVASELLSHEVIHERIQALMHSQETQDQLVGLLDERLGSIADTEAWLTAKWAELEPTVVEWGQGVRLDQAVLAEIDATMLDNRLTSAVQTCLGSAMLDLADAPELDRLVQIALADTNWFIKLVGGLNPGRIRSEIARIGGDLRDRAYVAGEDAAAAKILDAALPPLRHGLAGFIKGWNAMSDEQRHDAVVATLGHLREPLVHGVAELVHQLRDKLREVETLFELELVQSLLEELRNQLDQSVSDKIGEVVTGALKNLSAVEFRRNLENQTRNHLEMIRINGTVLGFFVGAGFGVLLWLFGVSG